MRFSSKNSLDKKKLVKINRKGKIFNEASLKQCPSESFLWTVDKGTRGRFP